MPSAEKLFFTKYKVKYSQFLLLRVTAVISSAVSSVIFFHSACNSKREKMFFNVLAIFIIPVALQLLKPRLNNVIPEDPSAVKYQLLQL